MGELNQNTLKHLRWMLQKDILKQDVFLIGHPSPAKRRLAMIFLEMTGREFEYVALTRDTTEADLKQRREILGGTAKYFDQVPVFSLFFSPNVYLSIFLSFSNPTLKYKIPTFARCSNPK